jgi:predicted flap endonuclease-1-like 5' DNA nuclease
MSAQITPNYGRRAILLILALGIVGVVAALVSNNQGNFLTFNLTHLIVLGVLFLIGGALLFLGVGLEGFSAGSIASLIIGIGIVAILLVAVLRLGNLAGDFLSFDLTQIFYLGILFVGVGLIVRSLVGANAKSHVPRRIAWTIIILGILAALIGFGFQQFNIAPDFLTFNLFQVFALGVLFIVVGVLLLLAYQGQLEAPAPPPMAQVRAAPSAPKAPPMPGAEAAAPAAPKPAAPPSPDKKDDLTVIEGIGPKSAEALYKAGIFTFHQVASLTPDQLEEIIRVRGGVNLVNDAKSWPKQARLLADGKIKEFEEYTRQLISSRDPNQKK